MRKISSYLYSNRIELLADLAGFTVENRVVYQRIIKIYKGVDNVIEFDIKNADQKRLDIAISPTITNIQLNVMDNEGNKLPNSPYTVSPLSTLTASATGATLIATSGQSTTTTITVPTANVTGSFLPASTVVVSAGISGTVTISKVISDIDSATTTLTVTFLNQTVTARTGITLTSTTEPIKGIGTVTVPAADLTNIDHQFLKYSVTATKGTTTIPLYADTQFGALGTIEVVGVALPAGVPTHVQILDSFTADLSYSSLINEYLHSSPALIRYYEAVPTSNLQLDFVFASLSGTVIIEATSDASISSESFPANGNPTYNPDGTLAAVRRGTVLDTFAVTSSTSTLTKNYTGLSGYTYIRVSFLRSSTAVNGTWMPGTGNIKTVTVTSS